MDYNYAYIVALFFTGAASSLITSYFSNRYQVRRDIRKYENERRVALENRDYTEKKENRDKLILSIKQVSVFLSYLEHSISLTSSLIDSSSNMTPAQFSVVYRRDLVQIRDLKGIVISQFPDFFDHVLRIEGHHNNYWGHQTQLLKIDIKEDKEDYESSQRQIIEIVHRTNRELAELNNELKKLSGEIGILNTI